MIHSCSRRSDICNQQAPLYFHPSFTLLSTTVVYGICNPGTIFYARSPCASIQSHFFSSFYSVNFLIFYKLCCPRNWNVTERFKASHPRIMQQEWTLETGMAIWPHDDLLTTVKNARLYGYIMRSSGLAGHFCREQYQGGRRSKESDGRTTFG